MKMKTKKWIKASMLLIMAALFVACTSENMAQKDKEKNKTPKGGVIFAANGPKTSAKRLSIDGEDEFAGAKTRTNIKYTPGNGAEAYWTSDDFIWVQKRDGTWAKSTAIELHDGGASAEFTLPGNKTDYADGCEVRYTGTKAYYGGTLNANAVSIPKEQSRTKANDFSRAGEWGDCGSGVARSTGNPRKFNFTLEHKPAYLCFLPRASKAGYGQIGLAKIKITATRNYDDPGSYMGDYCGFDGENITSSPGSPVGDNYIDVTITNGFRLTQQANQEVNSTYLIVRPGRYDFKIEYFITDVYGRIATTIEQEVTNQTLDKNVIYDITADLTEKLKKIDYEKYITHDYYMWDAKQNYCYGHGVTPRNYLQAYEVNYPKDNTDVRWYNESFPGEGIENNAQTALFKTLPNANEMCWYAYKGDAHWDNWGEFYLDERGMLQRAPGIWLKKKAKIMADEGITEAQMKSGFPKNNPTDYRTKTYPFPNWPQDVDPRTTPAPPNTTDYFFLPTRGYFSAGYWFIPLFSRVGSYWSSSKFPVDNERDKAYALIFKEDNVKVDVRFCVRGYCAQAFE